MNIYRQKWKVGETVAEIQSRMRNPHGFREYNYCFHKQDRENIYRITFLNVEDGNARIEGRDQSYFWDKDGCRASIIAAISDLYPIDLSASWLVNFGLVPHASEGDHFYGYVNRERFEIFSVPDMGHCVDFPNTKQYILAPHVHTLQNGVHENTGGHLVYTPDI